jgi:hypothetical protein
MLKVRFNKERETKNTVLYREQNEPPYIGALYVQKHALKTMTTGAAGYPETLLVTISDGSTAS